VRTSLTAAAYPAVVDSAWSRPNRERSFLFSIVVDADGQRYTNESACYVDFGHAVLERDKTVSAVPSWLVCDARHARRYLRTYVLVGGAKALIEEGEMVRGNTIAEVAEATGTDPAALQATVTRFNGFAANGVDEDFDRGRTAYDSYDGDP
jgi:3-oxosteroid 1-dehydrogenase